MNNLSNLALGADVKNEEEKDSLGGGYILDSGVYPSTVDMAYIDKSAGGALYVDFIFKTKDSRFIKQTIYITSGDAKGNKNYYLDKNGDKKPMPGYSQVNSIIKMALGKTIDQLSTEEKVINRYSPESKKEIPTNSQVLTELLNKPIALGVVKVIEDKTAKNDATGEYEPTGETREVNEIDKVFCPTTGRTSTEIKAEAAEPAFLDKWKKKWEGEVKNKAKGAASSGATAGAPVAQEEPAKPTTSLFD